MPEFLRCAVGMHDRRQPVIIPRDSVILLPRPREVVVFPRGVEGNLGHGEVGDVPVAVPVPLDWN
eukprot:10437576-Heterocapsa_arctica.AAC.1